MKKENPNSGKRTDNKNNKFLNIAILIIFTVGIILVFGDLFYSVFIQTLIIPVFSKFPNYNSGIGIGIFLLFLCLCPWLFYKGKNRIVYPKRRYYIESAFFIFYIGYSFLYHDEIIFYSIFPNFWFTYIDEILVCIIMAEFILTYYVHHNKSAQKYENNNKYYPFITDEPSLKDEFKRKNYAEVLIEKILITFAKRNRNEGTYSITKVDTKEEVSNKDIAKESDIMEVGNSSFVINISESYGYGKSSFFLLLKKEKENYDGKLILFEYRVWLCDSPKKIIGEFFRILSENLSPFIPDINRKINKYVSLLLEYSSSKSIFPYLLNNLFKEQSSILKERESLKNAIKQIDKPIVIIVDDIDRLHDDELMAFLSLLRNTADFPNVFYLLAADIEYIKQVLLRNGVEKPDSYLDKFINLEFLLPGYDSELMDKLFEKKLLEIFKQYESESSIELLKSVKSIFGNKKNWSQVFKNIRDMKRFFNVYSLAIDFYIKNNNNSDFNLGDDIDLADLFAVELIKYLSEPIYKILRDRDDLILEQSKPQFEQRKRYCLKDEYKKIVGKFTGLSKETKKAIKNFVNEKNKGNGVKNQPKEEEKSIKENDDIQTLIEKDKSEYLDESICLLLNFLFPENLTPHESKLCFPDAYFRYFLYRLKNNQMTVNEANRVFNLDVEEYKKRIQKIFKEGKQDSFIHKINFIKNTGHTDIDIVPKLFYFIEEASKERSSESHELIAISENLLSEKYNIFSLLFYWYDKSNYNNEEKIAELKKNMNVFILKDEHVNLLFLFLSYFIYLNAKTGGQRLVFSSNNDLRKIIILLVNKWLLPICELEVSNNFKWNYKYINDTFVSTYNLIEILNNVDFPGIEDLQKLLKPPTEINNCNLADHPFLQYIKKQSAKKYAGN